jgi:hypothetical protein
MMRRGFGWVLACVLCGALAARADEPKKPAAPPPTHKTDAPHHGDKSRIGSATGGAGAGKVPRDRPK